MSLAAFADVLIDLPLDEDRPYTYRVPGELAPDLTVGSTVLVPFGPRRGVAGLVVGLHDRAPTRTPRDVEAVLGGDLVPPALADLLAWVCRTYLAPPAQVWRTAMPAGVLGRKAPRRQLAVRLTPEGAQVLANPEGPATARQREVLAALARAGGAVVLARLLEAAGTTAALVRNLEGRRWVQVAPQRIWRSPALPVEVPALPQALTADQEAALSNLALDPPGVTLLHGVTGSGKTEVYLRAVEGALAAGRGALLLVPEIALTPQAVAHVTGRFGDRVAVLHSGLSAGERLDAWHRLRAGEARVVVGARSAVFAPIRDLGLIVVDEEHEGSYKQDAAPRYHARAIALERGRREGAAVVLGSATPSLESLHDARTGRYRLVEMPRRVADRPLPPVKVVDMRAELEAGNRGLFSRALTEALAGAVAAGQQAIVLLNRRGYSRCVLCRDCGAAVRCPACAVALTVHRSPTVAGGPGAAAPSGETQARLRCHYCEHVQAAPLRCPSCASPRIRHFGAGTQQVVDALATALPGIRALRLDRDTTGRKDAHARILAAFGRGEADVLVGTQMVAKGLDFPRVAVVGVLAADLGLNVPDFRAGERTFQLLTQVAGRAGRGEAGGQVVVQAYAPEHPALIAVRDGQLPAFYARELAEREALSYPPFGRLVNLVVASQVAEAAADHAQRLAEALREAIREAEVDGARVLGPVESAIPQLRGFHRFQVLLKLRPSGDDEDGAPQRLVRAAFAAVARPAGVRVAVDVDPYSLL